MAYLGSHLDTRLTPEESNEFKREIELLKENDPKNLNKLGLLDFDQALIKIIYKDRAVINRAKEYVINAFAACDLDGNGMCNFEEWILLNRHIEKDKITPEKLTEIFFEYSDLGSDEDKNMSFEKFALVCVNCDLFSD